MLFSTLRNRFLLQDLYFADPKASCFDRAEVLGNFKVVTKLAEEAAQKAIERRVELFDPLVGENACQIRTAMWVRVFNDVKHLDDLKEGHEVLAKINRALGVVKPRESTTLEAFLNHHHLNAKLSRIVALALHSYFLTMTKTSEFSIIKNESTNQVEPFLREDGVQKLVSVIKPEMMSRNSARSFYKDSRKKLSELSVSFVQEQSKVAGDYVIKDAYDLQQVPCYYGMKVVWESALKNREVIRLNITRVDEDTARVIDTHSFLYASDGSKFHIQSDFFDERVGYKIEAMSVVNPRISIDQFIDHFKKQDIIQMLMAFSAAHLQYGGSAKHLAIPYDSEMEAAKERFVHMKSLFKPYHIYPSKN